MKIDDVVALAKAGFTAEQISKMLNDPAPEPKKTDPEPEPKKQDPEPEPKKQDPAPKTPDEGYKELMSAISGLSETIKTMNIYGSKQPESQSVDDILAEIINPPKKD